MVITHSMLPVMMLVSYGLTRLKIATVMKKREKFFLWTCSRDTGQVTISGIGKKDISIDYLCKSKCW